MKLPYSRHGTGSCPRNQGRGRGPTRAGEPVPGRGQGLGAAGSTAAAVAAAAAAAAAAASDPVRVPARELRGRVLPEAPVGMGRAGGKQAAPRSARERRSQAAAAAMGRDRKEVGAG